MFNNDNDTDLITNGMSDNLTPELIAGFIYDWIEESEYQFTISIQSPNEMELQLDEYETIIDSDDRTTDELFENVEYDGEFIVRETKPQGKVIVYFFGDTNYNQKAILEEIGIHIDNLLQNKVKYTNQLTIYPDSTETLTITFS